MHAYIVVSLLTGARAEELALTGSHTNLDGEPPKRAVVAIDARGRGHLDATVAAHPRTPERSGSRTSSADAGRPESHAQNGTMAGQRIDRKQVTVMRW
jgi:hypothetical protein